MNKIQILPIEMLGTTKEYLSYRIPAITRYFIWFCFLLVLCIIGFIFLGKYETTVKATGIIRPEIDVSIVKNVFAGKIIFLNYKRSQKVKKGDILLKIDTENLEAQKEFLVSQLKDIKLRIEGLNAISDALYLNKKSISTGSPVFHARYDAFITEENRLASKMESDKRLWEEELALPASATTNDIIKNLKDNYTYSMFTLESFRSQFKSTIIDELEKALVEKDNIQSQLKTNLLNIKYSTIIAPIDGTIQEASLFNIGDYLTSGQEVMKIIPDNNDFPHVELMVPARDIGKLTNGLACKLQFPSFPYNEYKGANGKILIIYPDVINDTKGNLFFKVITDMDKRYITDAKGREYPLRVGLEVTAKIVLEAKPIYITILNNLGFNI
jgi:multidrug efflux pump subunit AcrA (membrane-fusion protein)